MVAGRPGAPRTLVFCHANGFPAGTYGALFEAWRAAGWQVLAPDRLGHDPAHPPTSGWPHLRDEMIAFIEKKAGGRPVALVGHSMGGYLSLLVASRRPQLVSAVVLLDSPIVAGWRAPAFGLLKLTGLIRRGGPGKASVRRREHWPSREAAHQHFGAKPAFARWDPRVLADYIAHGFVADKAHGGVRLAYRREIETRIYNTLPHHVGPLLRRHPVRCPVGFIAGRQSTENLQLGLAFVRRLAGERWRWMEGSHLFPMERPQETAQAVLELLGAGGRARQ
ncbi:MAG: alpha/beta hydrolase [Rubrivivax sp.]|nr:alpha/beta hydrolase [Rubrivivax sp.]